MIPTATDQREKDMADLTKALAKNTTREELLSLLLPVANLNAVDLLLLSPEVQDVRLTAGVLPLLAKLQALLTTTNTTILVNKELQHLHPTVVDHLPLLVKPQVLVLTTMSTITPVSRVLQHPRLTVVDRLLLLVKLQVLVLTMMNTTTQANRELRHPRLTVVDRLLLLVKLQVLVLTTMNTTTLVNREPQRLHPTVALSLEMIWSLVNLTALSTLLTAVWNLNTVLTTATVVQERWSMAATSLPRLLLLNSDPATVVQELWDTAATSHLLLNLHTDTVPTTALAVQAKWKTVLMAATDMVISLLLLNSSTSTVPTLVASTATISIKRWIRICKRYELVTAL
ncbi:hypothetical protein GYMLUDRAFT_41948, partial [Collybiopsis luxurians FD-317 M1]